MNSDEYQNSAQSTNLMGNNHLYHLLGLISEVGEVAQYITSDDTEVYDILRDFASVAKRADTVAKNMRKYKVHHEYWFTMNAESKNELGDCAWFLAMLASSYGWYLSDVFRSNIAKLKARKESGTIVGIGDNR